MILMHVKMMRSLYLQNAPYFFINVVEGKGKSKILRSCNPDRVF